LLNNIINCQIRSFLVDERLVFALTRAPLKLFMAEPMKKIVDCWNWLLSARPDLESLFLLDMIAAWHSAQQVETSKTKFCFGLELS
jgi:hypothetical protein